MSPNDWTEEEATNAMTYGVCRVCGAPRFTRLTVLRDGVQLNEEQIAEGRDASKPGGYDFAKLAATGRIEAHHGIVCPNGHGQF